MGNVNRSFQHFEKYFTIWEAELAKYTDAQLQANKGVDTWTIGQVYQHLIQATLDFHLGQVSVCCSNKTNTEQRLNIKGILAFKLLGFFPPIRIKVPASESYTPKQPTSKREIEEGMLAVKTAMQDCISLFAQNKGGKTQHPAFGFLSAENWYQLVGMHWKHHLRQKNRLDQITV
jgi:DinB superfamily